MFFLSLKPRALPPPSDAVEDSSTAAESEHADAVADSSAAADPVHAEAVVDSSAAAAESEHADAVTDSSANVANDPEQSDEEFFTLLPIEDDTIDASPETFVPPLESGAVGSTEPEVVSVEK